MTSNLTDEQIDVMQAGPELDAAVLGVFGEPRKSGCDESGVFRLVRRRYPSTDWTDAMWAAERFCLWDRHTFGKDNVYCVWEIDGPNEAIFAVATGETGPLAICRAILKLEHSNG